MTRLSFFALLGLVLATVSASAQTPEPAAPSPSPSLRAMSFNIRNSGAKDGENHWKIRQELWTATVRAFDPDLLGTQEVLADQFEDLRRLFPDYTLAGVARDDGARAGEWSAILWRTSRFEQLGAGNFWLSETPEKVGSRSWNAACVRICTWVRLRDRATGRSFVFANTHFDHESALARVESARLMSERLPLLAEGGPVVVTGDFNCTETDAAYSAFTRPTAEGRLAFTDSFRAVHPTRGKDEASFHGFKGTTTGSRIDWILHTPQLQARAAEIVRPAVGRHPSDHYPVTAVLEWKPQ